MENTNPTTPQEDDEIDLFELFQTLWSERKLIALITGACAALAIVVSLILPVIYKADVVVQVKGSATTGRGAGGGISALAGIASVAGVTLGGDQTLEATMGILKSKEMMRTFLRKNGLIETVLGSEKLEGKDDDFKLEKAREIFEKKIITIAADTKSGLTTVSVKWKDAELAAQWANLFVQQANSYLRGTAIERSKKNLEHLQAELPKTSVVAVQQAEYRLIEEQVKSIMVASVESEFAIKIIDPAVKPILKDSPKRAIIVIISTIGALFASILFIFARNALRKRRTCASTSGT